MAAVSVFGLRSRGLVGSRRSRTGTAAGWAVGSSQIVLGSGVRAGAASPLGGAGASVSAGGAETGAGATGG